MSSAVTWIDRLQAVRPGRARCVIRGDLEDKVGVDGPGFHYFSNLARMSTVRMSALRPGRNIPRPGKVGHRVISTCDVSNAFLQSEPFPREDRRFLKIRSPIDGSVTYWRHRIPLYGSCSAPARWEATFSTWLTTPESAGGPGFVRGDNEPSVHYHRGRDLLMVLYTDFVTSSSTATVRTSTGTTVCCGLAFVLRSRSGSHPGHPLIT